MGADDLHGLAVGDERVVSGLQDLGKAESDAGRVLAALQAETDEARRLVERHPVRHAVGELVHDDAGVVGEPVRAVGIQPAAAAVEFIGVIPVEEGHPRLDAGVEQFVDEPVVEGEPLGVDARRCRPGMTRGQEIERR